MVESNIVFTVRDDKNILKFIHDGRIVSYVSRVYPYGFVVKCGESRRILENSGYVLEYSDGWLGRLRDGTEVELYRYEVRYPNEIPKVRDVLLKQGLQTFESDIRYIVRMLIDREIEINFDKKYNVVYLDIEVDDSKGFPKEYGQYKILCIGCYDVSGNSQYFALTDYGNDEREMLSEFVNWLMQEQKTVIAGWNIEFDYKHILERLRYYGLWEEFSYFALCECVDLKVEYEKVVKGLTSYSLEEVSWYEGFEKVKHRDTLVSLMSPEELKEYNLYDVWLCMKIDEKYGFTDTVLGVCNYVNLPVSLVNPVGIGDYLVIRRLRELEQGMYVAIDGNKNIKESYQGAVVLEPVPGLHSNVIYVDVNCLIEGTKVIVKGKGVVNIEDVKEGDYVLGIRGWHRVKKVWEYDYEGEIINVNGLWSTPWHKHLVSKKGKRQWIRKDYQAKTLYRDSEGKYIFKLCDFGDKVYEPVDEKVMLISELIGILWAEGCVIRKDYEYFCRSKNKRRVSKQYKLSITISQDEVELRDRILYILDKLYAYKPYVKLDSRSKGLCICISRKDIFEDIMSWNEKWKELHYPSVLRGFFEGDGCVNIARRSIEFVQSERNSDVVERVCYMLDELGISYYKDEVRSYEVELPQGGKYNSRRIFVRIERYEDLVKYDALVGFISSRKYEKFKKCLERKDVRVYGNVIKREKIKVEKSWYCGKVYDLTLEGEPYFFANGVLTHNSLYPNVIIHKKIDIDGFNGEVYPEIMKMLLEKRAEAKKKYKETGDAKYNVMQLVYKIMANSGYGLFGYARFRYYNKEKAAMVTGGGREVLLKMKDFLENKLGAKVLYGDSVSGDSIVVYEYNGKMIKETIEQMFERFKSGMYVRADGKEEINLDEYGVLTLALDMESGKVEMKGVKRMIRHKVNKRMFRVVSESGKEVCVTEDHSLVVYDGEVGKFVERKPGEIKESDRLVVIDGSDEVMFEKIISVREVNLGNVYVYDLEVEGYHTFLVNGIFVHNTDSEFVSLSNLIGNENVDKESLVKVAETVVNLINDEIKPFAVKLEDVFKMILFMRDEKGRGLKKKYVALTYDGEYYYRGIELRKRNYCEFAKDVLRQVLDKVFKEGWTKSQIEKWLREVKRDLYRGKYDEKLIIAMAVNKDIEEYKSIPPHIRAYQIAREMGFEFTDYRVKYVFVKNHVFKGRKTDVMPILNVSDVKKYRIDYERYWNTQVIKPVKRILDSIDDVGGKLDRWFG